MFFCISGTFPDDPVAGSEDAVDRRRLPNRRWNESGESNSQGHGHHAGWGSADFMMHSFIIRCDHALVNRSLQYGVQKHYPTYGFIYPNGISKTDILPVSFEQQTLIDVTNTVLPNALTASIPTVSASLERQPWRNFVVTRWRRSRFLDCQSLGLPRGASATARSPSSL